MKKFLLLFFFAFMQLISFAQDNIGYYYDAAGNLLNRSIIMYNSKTMAKKQLSAPEIYSDRLTEHLVKIYPNPTQGILHIGITGLTETDKCQVSIYSVQGALIVRQSVNTDNVDINISNQISGIYILRVAINEKSTTWKIIKQ